MAWDSQPLDVINGPDSPLKPVFFAYDSDSLDDTARKVLNGNAEVLKTYRTWVITVEGHCDERGTAEYNLALGDRRALAAKNYLVSLGIPADRIRTVSYGNEFPFDPGAQRECVGEEPARAYHAHLEVRPAGKGTMRTRFLIAAVMLWLALAGTAGRAEPRRASDERRPAHAAGAGRAACSSPRTSSPNS